MPSFILEAFSFFLSSFLSSFLPPSFPLASSFFLPSFFPFFLLKGGTWNKIYKIFPSMKKGSFSSSVIQWSSKNVQITEKKKKWSALWMDILTNKSNISIDKIFPNGNLLSKSFIEESINKVITEFIAITIKTCVCFRLSFAPPPKKKPQCTLHITVLNLHNQWD